MAEGGSSAGAEAGTQTGTKLIRGEDDVGFFGGRTATLDEIGVTRAHVGVSFSVGDDGSVAGKITLKWEAGRWKAVEVEVSGDRMIPVAELTDGPLLASMTSSMDASIHDLCSSNSSIGGDNGGAAQVVRLGQFVAQNSTLGVGVEAGTQAQLDAPGGEKLPISEVNMVVALSGDQLAEVVIEFQVAYADWQRVDAGGWLDMPPEVRGETFAGGFSEDKMVFIDARLGDASLPLMAIVSENIWELGGAIHPEGPTELRSTESSFGMYVKQDYIPGPKVGFQTKWSSLGGPGEES